MALSIIEIAVYGFVTYFCLGLMLVSIFQQTQINNKLGALRIGFLVIGVVAAFMLAGSTDVIITESNTEIFILNETIYNGTGDATFTTDQNATTVKNGQITLQNPMWVTFHIMVGFSLIIYILIQAMAILRNPN